MQMKTTPFIRHSSILSVLMLLLVPSGCSDEDFVSNPSGNDPEDSIAVTFHFDGIADNADPSFTRTTWDTNEFPSGSLIGIYVLDENGNEVYSNAQYKYDATSRTFVPYTSAETIYTGSQRKFSYYAYSPHRSTATAQQIHNTWTYSQTSANNVKSADLLRAVNTTASKGACNISLTFRHMLCRLDVDYSHFAGLGYTEIVEQTLRLPAVNSADMNLLTGEVTYKSTSTMISWRGFSQDNARHLITTPYNFTARDSLGFIRFKRPQGDTAKISVKLAEDFKLTLGSKSVIKLCERTTTATTGWTYSSVSWGMTGSLDACATGTVSISPTVTETRTVQDYAGTIPVGNPYTQTRTYKPSSIRLTRYSGSTLFTVTISGGTASVRSSSENTTTAARTALYTVYYKDLEGIEKTISTRPTVSQPAGTRESVVGSPVLSSISVPSATLTACGVVTPGTCTASYTTTTSVVSGCGTVISASSSTSTKTVTASAASIAENTSTSSKTVTVTVTYSEGGVQKSTTVSATQPGATLSGGVTTWSTNSQATCSKYEFPYTMSTATLSCIRPTSTTTAKVTSCGTVVTPASSGTASVTWSVSAWSTSSTDTKATVSGTTLTVPANTGAARTATVTATFSNGTSKSFTITQQANTHNVDVE